jgi:gliding motility-associated-like protein
VSPTANATYTLHVTNSFGCSDSVTQLITVNAKPTAAISGTAIICSGSSTTLTASGTGNYLWSTTATTASTIVAPNATTTYTLTVTNNFGCSDTATKIITVNASPIAGISGTNSICTGHSATLTASGVGTYLWNTNATTTAITVSPVTTATYTLTVTNSFNCSDTASRTVTVNTYPVAVINGANVICKGQSTTLTASGGAAYIWNTNEITPGIIISPATDSVYSVVVSNGPCKDTATFHVTVDNGPTANAGVDVLVNAGSSTQLSGTGGGMYSWVPSAELSCANCQSPIAKPSQTTTYQLTVTDINGCMANASVTVEINCGEIFIPNAFSPNNDNENELECVYGNCIQSFRFIIFDRWGEKVFETTEPNQCWDGTYNGRLMNSAVFVYYFNATLTNGETVIKKGNINLVR